MEGLRIRKPNNSENRNTNNSFNSALRNQYGNVYANVYGKANNSGTNYNNTAYEVNTTELDRVINLHNRIATAAAQNPNLSPYNRAKVINRLRRHVNLPLKKNLLNVTNSNINTNTNTNNNLKLNAIATVGTNNGNTLAAIEAVNSRYNTPAVSRRRKTRRSTRKQRKTRRSRRA
jgi:hypothetical protein